MIKLRTILLYDKVYLVLVIVALLYSVFINNIYPFKSKYSIDTTMISGYIDNIKIDGNKLSILLLSKEKIIVNYYFFTEKEKKSCSLKLGDYVEVNGVMIEPENNTVFNLFNYKKYLYSNKIYYTFNADSITFLKKNQNIFYSIKQTIINHIDKMDKSSSYVKALVVGDDDGFQDEINETYQVNGVSHLFAISGSHITFISVLLLWLLKKLKVEENKRYYIVILFLFFYMFLTNYAGSVLRSVIFFILLSINKMYYFNIKTINILNLTLIVLLVVKPGLLYDVGFQFSYIISFYLIKYQDFLSKIKGIKSTFIISFISFLASIPICINNFFQINILSIAINIFFVPYVSFILFPLSFISLIVPFIDSFIVIFINILEYISIYLSNIKIGTIILCKPSIIIIMLYYLFISIGIKGMTIRKYCYFLPLILLIIIHTNINYLKSTYELTFIDVGQGDSILISLPNNKGNILIDTGGKLSYNEPWEKRNREYKIGKDTIIPYLKSIGIRKLDYLILTHGDEDHMGEAYDLISNFKVNKVLLNVGIINELEAQLLKRLKDLKIDYKQVKLNDAIVIDKYKFYILNVSLEDNENDNSTVIYTKVFNTKTLLTGDISSRAEYKIIDAYKNLDVDILKVGHHGSKTSTSELLLDRLTPKYAVINVGIKNRFNHPNKETIMRLIKRKINILKTSEKGTIKFIFRSNDMDIVYGNT